MDRTTQVINALDDSRGKSIEYQNRLWLRRNVVKMHIKTCISDCQVDIFDIVKEFENHNIIIQDGKKIEHKNDFHPGKEALLLIEYEDDNIVFLYSPKE